MHRRWGLTLKSTLLAAALLLQAGASISFGQDPGTLVQPVGTASPRDTLESFQALTTELEAALIEYRTNRTESIRDRVWQISEEFLSLIDLSSLPDATRRERAVETTVDLLDILGRVQLPALSDVPGVDAFDANLAKPASWTIPDTPIEIARIKDGPRSGEFLFSERTVAVAPRYAEEIRRMPLRSSLGIESWNRTVSQLTGPMIPYGLVEAVPDGLKGGWFGTPVWKVVATALLAVLAAVMLMAFRRALWAWAPDRGLSGIWRRLLVPVAVLLVARVFGTFVGHQLNVEGAFAITTESLVAIVSSVTSAWLFWLVAVSAAEFIVRSPRIRDDSLNASLVRLSAQLAGISGAVVILAYAANDLGLPVYSMLAGLGIGGLAVALAIRPTLENLVGGLILYADRPVRIGDYCMFNDRVGTVERIGVRSTQIRGLDRTLISVPNARLADMDIVNWAQCDQMLIQASIGLRYETEPDQLRHVLANLREMLYAHPKIDTDTVRVRFVGYGASSLDVAIRVYALTREWNEFFAIQEDILLRVADIVRASGSGFAFPSQTLYVGRDEGLDETRAEAAVDEVKRWRRSGRLPFPMAGAGRIDELRGTLDYPPRGSPDSLSPQTTETEAPERLSADDGGQEAAPPPPAT
jgi:MscS family membrane protein